MGLFSRSMHFDLRPRYTPGSPAAVWDRDLARRVAREEQDAHARALSGVYGPEEQARAERLGLAGIVLHMEETRGAWLVLDLITDERWSWPIEAKCPDCGRRKTECRRGILSEHHYQVGRYTGVCSGSGKFVGQPMEVSR